MFFHLFFLMCSCVNHNYDAYIHAMNEEEYQIISNLIKDGGRFLMSPLERTKVQKTAYVKYWRLKEKLPMDKNGLLLFEGMKVLKKREIKKVREKDLFKCKWGIRKLELGHYMGMLD